MSSGTTRSLRPSVIQTCLRNGDRGRREAERNVARIAAGARVKPPEPPVERVAEHPERAGADGESRGTARARSRRSTGAWNGRNTSASLRSSPVARAQALDERASGRPTTPSPEADRAREQVDPLLAHAGRRVVTRDDARQEAAVRGDVHLVAERGEVARLAVRGDLSSRPPGLVAPQVAAAEVGHPDAAGGDRELAGMAVDRSRAR